MSGKFIEVEEVLTNGSVRTILVARDYIVGLRVLHDLNGILMLAHGMTPVRVDQKMATILWEELLASE